MLTSMKRGRPSFFPFSAILKWKLSLLHLRPSHFSGSRCQSIGVTETPGALSASARMQKSTLRSLKLWPRVSCQTRNTILQLPLERCLRVDLTQKSLWCELTTPTTLWNIFLCSLGLNVYVGVSASESPGRLHVLDSLCLWVIRLHVKNSCESSSKVGWPLFSFSSHSHLFFKPIWRAPARICI